MKYKRNKNQNNRNKTKIKANKIISNNQIKSEIKNLKKMIIIRENFQICLNNRINHLYHKIIKN